MVNKNPTYLMGNVLTYHKSAGVTNIPVEHIKQLEALGEGAFGQVYKGKLFVTRTFFTYESFLRAIRINMNINSKRSIL